MVSCELRAADQVPRARGVICKLLRPASYMLRAGRRKRVKRAVSRWGELRAACGWLCAASE